MRFALPPVLVAELTHRCPLACPYCSNPVHRDLADDELDVATWAGLFADASANGVRKVRLSGGEPGARRDLVEIAACARESGLDTSLVTSGYGIATRTMRDLWEAGLHRIEVSFQDAEAVTSDHFAGRRGAYQRKRALAAEAVRLGLPLAITVVAHRGNVGRLVGIVKLAIELRAEIVLIQFVQPVGHAVVNGASLMPNKIDATLQGMEIESLRRELGKRIAIEVAPPEDASITVTPSGRAMLLRADGVLVRDLGDVRHGLYSLAQSNPRVELEKHEPVPGSIVPNR